MTPGFPAIGRTVPAAVLIALTFVAGAVAAIAVIGPSGWLIIALVLALGAAALPRAPFAAALGVLLAIVLVASGHVGYTPEFVILLSATHLMLVLSGLTAWLPLRARVQLRLLRPPLIRYVVVQVGAQLVSFGVLALAGGRAGAAGSGGGLAWLGVVGAVAAVVLAAAVLVPALLRPSR